MSNESADIAFVRANFADLATDDALHPLRQSALTRFAARGFPTTREEEWRFTNVAPIARSRFPLGVPSTNGVAAADITAATLPGPRTARLVFVDGHYRREFSTVQNLPAGVRVMSLAEAVRAGDPLVSAHLGQYARTERNSFVDLNTAFLADGALVHFDRNAVADHPIELLFVATDKATYPRNLIVAEEGAQGTVLEVYQSAGDAAHLTVPVTELAVAPNTNVRHCKLQLENESSYHVAAIHAHQERASNLESHNLTLGGKLTRHDIESGLDGEGIETTFNGLYLARGEQHVDNHTRLDHKRPHCDSHELYKGILDDKSSGVFSGYIHVYEDAQKTDAKQSSANLLLSDAARVDSQPQLEIYADDVKCTHGATIGQLDKDALFYLRCRGIGETEARNILIRAFAADITERLPVAPELRDAITAMLAERLPGGS